MSKRWMRALAGGAVAALLSAGSANAVLIGGVEFPQGAVSFADSVISYQPGLAGADPGLNWQGAFNALGVPNFTGAGCSSQIDCTYVSLGVGGALVLRFDDNVLTGSDSDADDLWIFEIGPDVEDTTVDVSVDGVTWLSVGSVGGSTRGIDIDFFGYDSSSAFRYVRLIDVAGEGAQSGATVGADIDAVGAISTRAVAVVPEPGTWALMIMGFGLAGAGLRSRRQAVA
ncbi:PEPxxWA-CTERM sorting domain-containing protein [Phenylobacterium kunshanense]|uniref:PEP-CTERM sorting domain-containing protein n=1 Tax=Phenylobacterium kunshanense TaxID=1445034 RepID=A0A328BTA7_9CAUL|nr:PEPxxWA-CTERM sorting domain-containing protein [Phenylobacterium kunshanense]RAK69094.1 PEP-CTERM sorting domain-containing protein [Phenylobacterium kunshanense]